MPPSLSPQSVGKNDWYYEVDTHLLLVHEVRDADNAWIRTDQIKISWKKIEASLQRVSAPRKS